MVRSVAGNKSSRHAIRSFLARPWLLDGGIHLLLVDVHLPGRVIRTDSRAILAEIGTEEYTLAGERDGRRGLSRRTGRGGVRRALRR